MQREVLRAARDDDQQVGPLERPRAVREEGGEEVGRGPVRADQERARRVAVAGELQRPVVGALLLRGQTQRIREFGRGLAPGTRPLGEI